MAIREYSDDFKRRTLILYKTTGNISETCRKMDIAKSTFKIWMKQDWWRDWELELRHEARTGLSTNVQNVVDKALREINDRLDNGDYIYDSRQKEFVRRPVNAKVASDILHKGLDRQDIIDKLKREDSTSITNEKIQEKLMRLADEFGKFANMKLIEHSEGTSQGEKTQNALPEERETGLQSGTGMGAPASGSPDPTECTPCSTSTHDEEGISTQRGQSSS